MGCANSLIKQKNKALITVLLLVGATGFEPLPGWVDFIDVSERLSKTMATIKADYL
jgi:hypothetical protein